MEGEDYLNMFIHMEFDWEYDQGPEPKILNIVRMGNLELLKKFVEKGLVDLEEFTSHNFILMHINPDTNQADGKYYTALRGIAAENGHTDIVEYLDQYRLDHPI